MFHRSFLRLLGALVLCLPLAFASSPAQAKGEVFYLVSHAPDTDTWWNTIKNAIRLGGKQMGVKVIYRNPTTGDLADMASIINQVAAEKPDAIITTIADFDILKGPISNAVKAGIPVMTINSGTQKQSEALGALMHVGQPEHFAGLKAGERAKKESNAKSFLCVNHFITNPVSIDRCRGFAEGLGVKFNPKRMMIDSGTDFEEIKGKVISFLQKNKNVDAILTLGPTSAHPTIAALKDRGMAGKIYFGTFDSSEEILNALDEGIIAFGIDQQPFLQSYLPVVLLANYVRYGVLPGNHINSGPNFITKSNKAMLTKNPKYR